MAVLTAINGARELSRKGCMRIGREDGRCERERRMGKWHFRIERCRLLPFGAILPQWIFPFFCQRSHSATTTTRAVRSIWRLCFSIFSFTIWIVNACECVFSASAVEWTKKQNYTTTSNEVNICYCIVSHSPSPWRRSSVRNLQQACISTTWRQVDARHSRWQRARAKERQSQIVRRVLWYWEKLKNITVADCRRDEQQNERKTLRDVVSDLAQTNTKLDRRAVICSKKKKEKKEKEGDVATKWMPKPRRPPTTSDGRQKRVKCFLSIFLFGFRNFVYRTSVPLIPLLGESEVYPQWMRCFLCVRMWIAEDCSAVCWWLKYAWQWARHIRSALPFPSTDTSLR